MNVIYTSTINNTITVIITRYTYTRRRRVHVYIYIYTVKQQRPSFIYVERNARARCGSYGGNKCDCYLISHDENHAYVSILLTRVAFKR